MKRSTRQAASLFLSLIVCSFATVALAFLMWSGFFTRLPSWNQLKFYWAMHRAEEIKPLHELTDFEWDNVCLEMDFGWLNDNADNYDTVLNFHLNGHAIDKFYLNQKKYRSLVDYEGYCFPFGETIFVY